MIGEVRYEAGKVGSALRRPRGSLRGDDEGGVRLESSSASGEPAKPSFDRDLPSELSVSLRGITDQELTNLNIVENTQAHKGIERPRWSLAVCLTSP